ncbi:glycosyltransferase [Planomonospora sp. ID67723]|uniref:glycosyltransferase n=1 Tax=Planomonospora sp. ID67723 TaxID=2738134 RepID=UPI0018C36916|nr:glycosyltransferase [Planomonospora sp. ID67723]MBG0827436.1 glycosyltransferase [Planomonospora sp. ID67723]
MAITSVVVPAHNEGRVIGRLIGALLRDARPGELDVVVVANGCDDDTADVAAARGARVVETPVPSKREALRLGDTAARGFPRVYVDADVELGTADVRALREALDGGVLAAAPERVLALAGRPWTVRAYYAVWTRLPAVRDGLFGRGVIAVSEEGNRRIMDLPPVMGDDLAASLAFAPGERAVVPSARVVVHPPRTLADLLRRRVRAVTAVAEIARGEAQENGARTGLGDLLAIARREPGLLPHLAVFLLVTLAARVRARRAVRARDYTTWLRDESSRT